MLIYWFGILLRDTLIFSIFCARYFYQPKMALYVSFVILLTLPNVYSMFPDVIYV